MSRYVDENGFPLDDDCEEERSHSDEEVNKGLECCSQGHICAGFTCPFVGAEDCIKALTLDALSLINRQKAEIERLQKHIKEGIDLAKQIPEMLALAQAEAIKEVFDKLEERLFVHSFKTKSEDYTQGQVDCMDFVDSRIEELKKEMVGESDG